MRFERLPVSEKGGLKTTPKMDPLKNDIFEPKWIPGGAFGRGRRQRRGLRGGKEGTSPSGFGEFSRKFRKPPRTSEIEDGEKEKAN